ncbi:MAG: hypothetical protein AAB213_02470 [Candidatus Omnitrophota bacterium]|mgnify:CR=1 FL=1
MKKIFLCVLMLGIFLCFTSLGECWSWGKQEVKAKDKAASAPVVVAPANPEPSAVVPEVKKADVEKTKSLREKKKSELNNTEWEIEAMALSGKGAKQSDILVFKDNKFSSEEFLKTGFKESNYTLSVLDSGMVVVETMQTSEKEGAIFWRAEFDASLTACKGVMSRQLSGNKTEDYSFASVAKKPIL